MVTTDPELPEAYANFSDVFSEKEAEVLPFHHPYDWAIDLLPGAPLPKGRTYPLSLAEITAIEYIEDRLRKGFIHPSTSPTGQGSVFWRKKMEYLGPALTAGLSIVSL